MFPGAFNNGIATPSATSINTNYKGWNVQIENLFFANGKSKSRIFHHTFLHSPCYRALTDDPWRDATVSADGLSVASTSTQPIGVSDGFHCSDMITQNGRVDSTVLAVQQQGLAAIKGWLQGEVPSKRTDSLRFARKD